MLPLFKKSGRTGEKGAVLLTLFRQFTFSTTVLYQNHGLFRSLNDRRRISCLYHTGKDIKLRRDLSFYFCQSII